MSFLTTLYRSNKVLTLTGWIHWILFATLACIYPFDDQTILGIERWIKPMKFSASIAIYVWTLAWFLRYLTNRQRAVRVISWGVATTMIIEIVCIVGQAARGTTSHFNGTSPLNAVIFGIMGLAIGVNSLLAIYTLVLFFREDPPVPPAYLWGIRLGFCIFLLASFEGAVMVRHMGHTVGAADGGLGLPFVNWSREHGDLRVAHFVGMHALQILPFAGYLLARSRQAESAKISFIFALSGVYLVLMAVLGWQAWQGHPLLWI